MRKMLWPVLFVLTLSACVTIPNTRKCSVAGLLDAGMICAETITGKTSEMNLLETIEFLEPQPEGARAGAICQSAEDYRREKDALEQACRMLGNRCTPEIQHAIGATPEIHEDEAGSVASNQPEAP